MKRIFKLGILAAALSLCFSGCASKSDKKSDETVSEFKDDDIVLGEVVDGVYTSKMLDLKFDGNVNDMDVTAEEEFTNRLDGKVVKRSDMEAVHDRLDKGYYIGDMEAYDNKNKGNHVEVEIYKDIHHEMKDGLENYIDKEVKKQRSEQKERFKNPKVEKTTRDFLGDKLLSVDVIIDEDGIESADTTLYKKMGEYFMEIHVRGDNAEDIDRYLGMFEKYSDSGNNAKSSKADKSDKADTKSDTDKKADTDTKAVEETSEVNGSEDTLELGSVSDKVYSNKMLNIKFDISKTGLDFVSEEGLKNLGNDGIDKSDLDAVKKHIEDGKSFTDMFAVDNNDTTKKISVSLAKNDMLMPMDEYLDAHKAVMESQLSKVPKDQLKSSRVKKSDAHFLGNELSCLDIYVDTTVGKQCQKYLFVVKDHYMMIIVSSGKDEKEAQKGLDLFQQYQ
ncbi:hypothetical protein EHW90_11725 [Lachnoanaerobaculum orale]|uniref:Lipoprotein n=1 Tax=Lachnoanaerobaculum orale TaxID=979627 RepID=A0A3P3Q1P2_9FIRM|nr:hypothetical protein [Lachnoanaerobaculum orale]RRJ14343.1 hypothetical protein EHW90_11725 [Lachnoanaerobaculum orale]